MTRTAPEMILQEDVVPYLKSRNLTLGSDPRVSTLTDGVSALVYRVDANTTHWVVKQALPELRVSAAWSADPRRAMTEARALQLVSGLTPAYTPELIDADEDRAALVMTAAPSGWTNWRRRLLEEDTAPVASNIRHVATALGRVLGTWHRETWEAASVARQFADDEAFEQLRIAPFYRAIQSIYPDLRDRTAELIDQATGVRECFVHGDFSPKNILTGNLGVWVLDFEVARFGASVFDLAFLTHHLALKAIARPALAADLRAGYEQFISEYRSARQRDSEPHRLGWHAAALLLARVDGVSPASYLTENQRTVARDVALRILRSDDSSATAFWDAVVDASRIAGTAGLA